MPAEHVFLDTSALLALVNSADEHHAAAIAVRDRLDADDATLLTTHWVLAEFLNHTSPRARRRVGARTVAALKRSPRTRILQASSDDFDAALALYQARPDKDWSLVDCTSMLACRAHRVRRVFTHDQHFRQAGFQTLL